MLVLERGKGARDPVLERSVGCPLPLVLERLVNGRRTRFWNGWSTASGPRPATHGQRPTASGPRPAAPATRPLRGAPRHAGRDPSLDHYLPSPRATSSADQAPRGPQRGPRAKFSFSACGRGRAGNSVIWPMAWPDCDTGLQVINF